MVEMKAKERLLAAITGKEIDRVPWSPFLAYYWDFVDPKIAAAGQVAFLQKMGADPLIRGSHTLFELKRDHCEIIEKENNGRRLIQYDTPVGSLKEIYTYAPSSNTWFLTEHPVSCEEDVKVLQYLFENTHVVENASAFEKDQKKYGEEALFLPVIGTGLKTAMQSLVEHWFGTVELVYGLEDYPQAIEECLQVMRQRDMETVQVSLNSSAEGFIFWEDSSTTNLSPDLFSRYTLPQINEWGKKIHEQGKLLIHHACGHLRNLIPLMAQSEIDAIESLSPAPTGDIEVEEAFSKLPKEMAIIGGIEPTFFLNSSMDELRLHVLRLLEITKGRRYVLANSDSCPPYVEEEKFHMISNMLHLS